MEWLFSIEPVRSFRLWLLIRKFSCIQLGPTEPLSKPVAQEYCWAGAFRIAEELMAFAGMGACAACCVLALAPSAGSRRPASAIPVPAVIVVMVLFMIRFSLKVDGLYHGHSSAIAIPRGNVENPRAVPS